MFTSPGDGSAGEGPTMSQSGSWGPWLWPGAGGRGAGPGTQAQVITRGGPALQQTAVSSSPPEKMALRRPLPSWDDVDLEVAYKLPDHSVFLKST